MRRTTIFSLSSALPAFALLCAFCTPAHASPWTLRRGVALMQTSFGFQMADSEFIDVGPERSFPLRGRLMGTSLDLGLRLGLSDRIEVEVGVPLRAITYTSDPAVIRRFRGVGIDAARDFYVNNVIDFSQSATGVGDVRLAGRYQLALEPLAVAAELALKIPTGYDGPEGTFGRTPLTVDTFEANPDDFVQPDRVRDDVTFGDAQVDVAAQLLLGTVFDTGTFIRLGVGYNYRLQGAGDQFLANVQINQTLSPKLLFFAFGRLAYSVEDGDSIGISIAAIDPDQPPEAFVNFANTRAYIRPLQNDQLEVGGGLIWRVGGDFELNVSYGRVVWGQFTAASHSLSMGVGLRLDFFEGS
ncbi:MAG: hypothetical protein AAFV29_09020 [Myxococcota bacterium]